MTDRWLTEPERLREMADAGLMAWLGLNQAQQSQPRRIRECFEGRRKLSRISGIQRFLQ